MFIRAALWLAGSVILLPLLQKENRFWSDLVGILENRLNVILCYLCLIIFSAAIYFPWASEHFPVIVAALFFGLLISLSILDAKTQYIPNVYSLGIATLGLFVNFFSIEGFNHPIESLLTGALSYCSLFCINEIYKKFKGFDGMGMGDAKLFAALGCWFGLEGALPIMIVSNTLFIGVFFVRGWLRPTSLAKEPIAFGPYLAIAGCLMFLTKSSVKPLASAMGI